MVNQTITLQLGGKDRTLLFGVNGYYNYIQDATKKDPFEWLMSFDEKRKESNSNLITVLIEDVVVLVYAGINSQLDSLDQENVPLEKVKKWCNGISPAVSSDIFRAAFGTVEPGELTTQAGQENGAANT